MNTSGTGTVFAIGYGVALIAVNDAHGIPILGGWPSARGWLWPGRAVPAGDTA